MDICEHRTIEHKRRGLEVRKRSDVQIGVEKHDGQAVDARRAHALQVRRQALLVQWHPHFKLHMSVYRTGKHMTSAG